RTPLEHVLRHRRFRQWLPGEDDWLVGRFQSGAPAFPLFRFGSGGGGDDRRSCVAPSINSFVIHAANRTVIRVSPDDFPLRPELLVNRLAHVKGLGEAGAIKPHQTVADLKTGIFDSAGQTMISAGAAES